MNGSTDRGQPTDITRRFTIAPRSGRCSRLLTPRSLGLLIKHTVRSSLQETRRVPAVVVVVFLLNWTSPPLVIRPSDLY